jgi:UDP-N-acetylmuramyl-tripeptide synthetase
VIELEVRSHLVGAFNADNILMAAACCHAAGVPDQAIVRGIAALRGVPGRLEPVEHQRGDFAVLVDYAHTPDALERAIAVLRPLCRGRLMVVFGCGGDRDRTKRPLMGRAVARGADLCVITSDNPRTEEPLSIIEAILAGVTAEAIPRLTDLQQASRGYLVEPDRRHAIEAAVAAARPGDILLIAGKGHEDYQILGRTRIHFDDREEAAEALRRRGPV